MRAVIVINQGPASLLELCKVSTPACKPHEVIIAVSAAGVNRADLLQRAGKYPPPPGASEILGLEVSGTVAEVGASVNRWRVGDRVCALLSGGGYAEKVAVNAEHLLPIPTTVTEVEAAAIPEAFLTAYTNLVVEGNLRSGESVLIHGGSSGVGTAAIQVARVSGARIACTVGGEEKASRCRALGAEAAINYKTSDFSKECQNLFPRGFDVILDMVGQEYFERNLGLLAPGGRLVSIASMSGAKASLDIGMLMKKRARVIGSVLRSRSDLEKASLIMSFEKELLAHFETRAIAPVVDRVYSFDKVADAHERMRSSAHVGKILLSW